ncbi:hypothetical protein FEF26_14305 [Nesterenkonia salmonea]|uniref:Uncharacterized protein n=1 Tax=Nesterenkonia salmonea TaxID=1804987 RepID=A0A5R9B787_9MICC|nr:hypothetical protein [Nesterenkonia salmonea]TLP92896.1 hypothetical protein FEF26_14305 [Nesterenkonia salmonea]
MADSICELVKDGGLVFGSPLEDLAGRQNAYGFTAVENQQWPDLILCEQVNDSGHRVFDT